MINTINSMKAVNALLLSSLLLITYSPICVSESNTGSNTVLGLAKAVKIAQLNDPWLVGNQHTQDAVNSMSDAAGMLPDPKVSIGLANIAADTFDFAQESMTQFKVAISQHFPRGNSLAIKKKQLELIASQYPYQRQDRKAQVAVTTSKLWLDAYKAQESIALIEKNKTLFEQLSDVANANYSTAIGKTRQQDIVRAELELTRLEDRLSILKQQQEMAVQQLMQWLNDSFQTQYTENNDVNYFKQRTNLLLARQLPTIKMLESTLYTVNTTVAPTILFKYLARHPAVKGLDQKIKASNSGIKLAKQKYKPEWGVNVGYGLRDNDAFGNERADLFSFGISFDVPLFTANRQDKHVQSAVSEASAVKTEKWLLLRKLMASFESSRAQLRRLNERQALYQSRLLPQMHDLAEAALTAYTNDDGDFSEVVRARIAELNATIDALSINVERQKSIIQLNYFFIESAGEIINYDGHLGEYK